MPVIARYAAITLPPLLALLLAGVLWGGLAYVALIWLTLATAIADQLLEPPKRSPKAQTNLPWGDLLSVALAIGHMLLLPSTTLTLAAGLLTFGQSVALFLATASFMGQVSHPNAHELIHRSPRALRALGAAVYASVGFGHHVSAHRLVHHRHVGSDADPNTPRRGESFWTYLPRAWRGSFEAGITCEVARLDRKGLRPTHFSNPYWAWLGGALAAMTLATALAGLAGALALFGLGLLTGTQILMSDYVQHYGLRRLPLSSGRLEPVAPHHSWNAPKGFSSYLMLNAPAHSEHHMHPDRPYGTLDPEASVPTLPYSMPVMAMIALAPRAWSRIMDKRAERVMREALAKQTPQAPAASPDPIHPAELRAQMAAQS